MRNYWQLQRWFQSQEVQKHQFYQNRRVYFIHNTEDFSPLETRYRSSVDGLQKESDGGSALFLNPVCLFWPSQLCASSRYCVAADERVKNVLWDFSKRTVFKKTVALWVGHNKHTPGWRSISRLLRQRRLFFSDIRALIFSPCLKWAVNCHGSVTGLWAFFSLLLPFDRIHCEPLLCSKMIDYSRFYLGTWKPLVVIHLLLRRSHLMSQ